MNATAFVVRRARPTDAADFVRLMGDPEVFGNLMQLPLPSEIQWRKRLEDGDASTQGDLHAVVESGGQLVGSAGLHPNPKLRRRHTAVLGISVAKSAQGQGVGTLLMQTLCDYADHWSQILRIELTVFVDNPRAIALYRRFGFQLEGTHRGYALRQGRFEDVHCMARLHPCPPVMAWPQS